MTIQEIILLTVVAVVGLPSAWKNPTAAALCLSFIFAKILYLATGDGLAVQYYLLPDIFVLGVIFCKPDYHNYELCGGDLHQLKCMWLERSPSDRCVMAIFPLVWLSYAAPVSPYLQWHSLWALAILQFLFASAEPLETFFTTRRNADAANSLPHKGDLLVAYRNRGYA